MAASNKTVTILGSSAVCTRMAFRRVVVNGQNRIEAFIDGVSAEQGSGNQVELSSSTVLLPLGGAIETSVLSLMNGAALVQLRTANGLES